MQMNFMIFLLSSTTWKSSQATPTFYLLGIDADCPHKNENLRLFLVMKKTHGCPEKGIKSGVNRDSHLGKNCHHFCCAPARTTYGSPADKYNLFLFFSHFTCTFHLWNIKTSRKVPVNPLAPQHPSSGMCCFPESSPPAVKRLRPIEREPVVRGLLTDFPASTGKEQTLSTFRQSCLYARKLIASWLHYKYPVNLHPRAWTRGIFRSSYSYTMLSVGAQTGPLSTLQAHCWPHPTESKHAHMI